MPLLTLGFGTAAIMVHAAVRKRNIFQYAAVPVYLCGLVFVLAFDPDRGGSRATIFGTGMTINMGLGFVHAVAIRAWVFGSPDGPDLRDQQKAALAAHADVVEARKSARRLAVEQPQAARELEIGRPDLPNRTYPDGGLVDVNHVSADALTRYADVPAPVAARIIELRDRVGSFSSVEDLEVFLDQDDALEEARDRLLFLPRE